MYILNLSLLWYDKTLYYIFHTFDGTYIYISMYMYVERVKINNRKHEKQIYPLKQFFLVKRVGENFVIFYQIYTIWPTMESRSIFCV